MFMTIFAHMQLTANGISDTVNVSAVRERVHSLLRGCKCSKGCVNKRCGCRSKGKLCSIGCQCLNCVNTDNVKHKQVFFVEKILRGGKAPLTKKVGGPNAAKGARFIQETCSTTLLPHWCTV